MKVEAAIAVEAGRPLEIDEVEIGADLQVVLGFEVELRHVPRMRDDAKRFFAAHRTCWMDVVGQASQRGVETRFGFAQLFFDLANAVFEPAAGRGVGRPPPPPPARAVC